jgi:hypothetical protein
MLLTVERKIKEQVEVNPPCWLYNKQTGRYSKITAAGDIVIVGMGFLCLYDAKGINAKNEIRDAIREGEPCSEADFEKALKTQIIIIENA